VAAKVAAGDVAVVEVLEVDGKTKSLVERLALLGAEQAATLVVAATLAPALSRAARNVPWLTVETPSHVSVYQLLQARRVVFERAALLALQEALAE